MSVVSNFYKATFYTDGWMFMKNFVKVLQHQAGNLNLFERYKD